MSVSRMRARLGSVGTGTLFLVATLATPVPGQVTIRLCVDASGQQGNGASLDPSLSADGRLVAFTSVATNFVSGDTNGCGDVFIRDRQAGTNVRVSLASNGVQGDDGSSRPCMSPDGRFVAFDSFATNLVPGDTNAELDVFVHDRQSGVTERVSISTSKSEGNFHSDLPSISADGRYVAFESSSSLVPEDTNGPSCFDVYVRDLQTNAMELVAVDPSGVQGNGCSGLPFVSADGRFVSFSSSSTNLVVGDTNARIDVFVRDRQLGTTERVSLGPGGVQADIDSGFSAVSADDRYVVFDSAATHLVVGDTNGFIDLFVRDRQNGTTERVSLDSAGRQANAECRRLFSVSADGRCVAFESFATNLAPWDTNASDDVFVRDRLGGPDFTSLCDPGVGGVLSCPCSNAPASPARGCDNSSATGGAILSAIGGTYLSSDSLVFTANGEKANALSIVLQGNVLLPTGLVFGQGVRCVGGALKRLYTKTASGGSVTAPDYDAGDLTVSARSAAKGDLIQVGQSRWYLVYYRDPIVLGGCPVTSTFNATQTGAVSWTP
jgi:Tol biopolymer transport system component